MSFVFVVLGTLLWSVDTLIRYPLLGTVGADTMVFIEHLYLVLFFVPILVAKKFSFKKMNVRALISFTIIGMVGSAAATLAFTKAFSMINPSLVILLQKLQPIVAVTLSAVMLKEQINKEFLKYGALAFAGAFAVSFDDIKPLFSSETAAAAPVLVGYALTLFAVLGWGASTVFGKQLSLNEFSEGEIMAGRFIFGFLFLFAFCAINSSLPAAALDTQVYGKILAMVILSGLLGMYFYYKGMAKLDAHMVSVAELFFPLSAVVINWIFLGKSLSGMQITGGLILLFASWKVQNLKKS